MNAAYLLFLISHLLGSPAPAPPPPARLTVEVADTEGAPIEGAQVRLQALGDATAGGPLLDVDPGTDEKGLWTAETVEPGETEIVVGAIGYEHGRRVVELAAGTERRERFELAAVPSEPVELRFVDGKGAPVPGARAGLAALPQVPGATYVSGTSDGEGVIAWPRVPLGRYELTVRPPDGFPGERPDPLRLEVAGSPVEREIVLRRTPGRPVEGTVVDPSGEGVADVEIFAHSVDWTSGSLHTTSGPDGTFGFDHVPYGIYRVTLGPPGVSGESAEEVRVDREPEPWRLRVPDAESEAGRPAVPPDGAGEPREERFVVWGNLTHRGEPLAGAAVGLSRQGPPFAQHGTRTDASGAFEIADVSEGDYTLSVGWQGRAVLLEVVTVDGPTDLTDRIGDLGFARVRGRVEIDGVDPSTLSIGCGYRGSDTPGKVVIITSDTYPGFIHPRRDGSFEVGPLRGGRWAFTVDAPGHAPLEREVTLAGQDVDDLVLAPEPTPGLVLRLVSESGALPDHVSATYRSAENGREIREYLQPTEPTVAWPSVPVGRGTVELETDFVRIPPFPFDVPGPPVEIHLPPRGVIRLEAPLVGDDQLGGARLTVRSLDHADRAPKSFPLRRRARTVYDLRPGLYELTLATPDGTTWSEIVEVRDQETARVRFD